MSGQANAGRLPFGQRLTERVLARESQLVLGLDPDPARLWPIAAAGGHRAGTAAERAAAAVLAHCRAVIDAVAPAVVAVKLQLACFERLGAAGWAALAACREHAANAGLLVIADGKRGDIDVSAQAYAEGLFGGLSTPWGTIAGLDADAATVSPYMGGDTLAPFVDAARKRSAAVFVLVRTSNPGAADLQERPSGTRPLWESVATLLKVRFAAASAATGGLSDVGAVIGATAPQQVERARELLPEAVFLLPGVGAQGGRIEDLKAAFAPGPAAGLVTVSRAIVGAAQAAGGGDPATAARSAAERLRALAWETALR